MQLAWRESNLPITLVVVIAGVLTGAMVGLDHPIAVIAIAVASLVFMVPVEASFGLFAISVPFDTAVMLGSSGATLSWLAGALSGSVLLLYGLATGRFRYPTRSTLWWGLFSLWTAASVVWAIDSRASLQWIPTVMSLIALYTVGTSFLITPRQLRSVFLLTIVGATVAAAVVLYRMHSLGLAGRATLAFGTHESNPNDFAVSLLLPFALTMAMFTKSKKPFMKVMLAGALALIVACIFFAMSRGSLLALFVIAAVFLVRVGIRRQVLLPILVLLLPLLFLPELFYERLKEIPGGRGTGRLDIFIAGTEVVKHYPILGAGLANFGIAYNDYAGHAPIFRGYGRAAHNAYLQIWGETGAIGLLLFIAAIYVQMRATHRRGSRYRPRDELSIAVEAACWGLLVAALSGSIQWSKTFWLAFIFLGMVTRQSQSCSESLS